MKAVVFVDVQKDFIDGALKNDKAIEVTPKIVEFAKECMQKGYKLYATRDTHEKTKYFKQDNIIVNIDNITDEAKNELKDIICKEPQCGYLTTLEGKKLPVEHCIEGTDGWMIDERLWNVIEGKVTVVNKPTFGSFDLAELIAEDAVEWTNMHNNLAGGHHNIRKTVLEEIIICGFVTSICVISNALLLRAKFPNAKITIKKDLCAGLTDEDHNAALTVAKMCQIDVE